MTIPEMQSDVRDWLKAEHRFRQTVRRPSYQSASPEYLMLIEVPDQWHRFRDARRTWRLGQTVLDHSQATRQLLLVTATAQDALVRQGVREGNSFDYATEQSWFKLDGYERSVASGEQQLPPHEDLLAADVPIEASMPAASPELADKFTYFAGLAVVHLMDAADTHGMYIMPRASSLSDQAPQA
ncbi:MAG TPA: hypothetical protein VGE30_01185 [Candidatus Saccharimonadales bacterium]